MAPPPKTTRLTEVNKNKNIEESINNANIMELKRMFNQISVTLNEIKENQKTFQEEIVSIKSEMVQKEKKWEKEKKELTDRLTKLEQKAEQVEKKERKCNLIIRGLEIREEVKQEEITKFLEEEVKVKAKVIEARKLGKQKNTEWLVKMDNWEDKLQVLQNKKNLKGKKIFIDNDRTSLEREQQKSMIEWLKENEYAGKEQLKIGYQKFWWKGKAFKWDPIKKEPTNPVFH